MPPRSAKKGVAKKLTSPAAATKTDPAPESPPPAGAVSAAEAAVTPSPEVAPPMDTTMTPPESAAADGDEVTTTVSVVKTEVVDEKVVVEVATEEVEDEEEVDPEEVEEDEAVATMDLDEAVKNVEQKPGDAVDGAGDGQHSGGDNNGRVSAEEDSEDEEDPSTLMEPLLTEKDHKEFEIFVGKLDKEAVEDDLVKVFGVFGEIKSVRIVKHPSTQKSKGFGFVRYVSMENARKALAELKDGVEVKGKQVEISASNNNDTLYLGNICKTWTKDNVMDALKSYGVDQLESIVLPDDSKKDWKIKGYALLQYGTHAEAVAAFQRLRKPDAVFGCEKSAKVAFSISLQPKEEAMSQVKSVYFEGITESWDEDKVRELCKQYGEIEKVRLSRDFTRAKKKDYGFVEFTTHESAVACVEGLNNAELGEGEIKVKANLAKPKNKGRFAKQQVLRGGFPVKKDGEVSEEVSKIKKKNVKSKEVPNKGKEQSKDVKESQASKSENKDKASKSEGKATPSKKRGLRGAESSTNDRLAKKSRNNSSGQRRGGRPTKAFGNQRTSYMAPPATYVPRYTLPPTSYQGHPYAGTSGANRRHSDLEPHGGYLPPPRGVHSSYGSDPRRAAAYASQPSSGSAYPRAAVVHAPYPGYQSFPGYEGGYPYPSSGAYDPRRGYY